MRLNGMIPIPWRMDHPFLRYTAGIPRSRLEPSHLSVTFLKPLAAGSGKGLKRRKYKDNSSMFVSFEIKALLPWGLRVYSLLQRLPIDPNPPNPKSLLTLTSVVPWSRGTDFQSACSSFVWYRVLQKRRKVVPKQSPLFSIVLYLT